MSDTEQGGYYILSVCSRCGKRHEEKYNDLGQKFTPEGWVGIFFTGPNERLHSNAPDKLICPQCDGEMWIPYLPYVDISEVMIEEGFKPQTPFNTPEVL